jgi:hypothetical protein
VKKCAGPLLVNYNKVFYKFGGFCKGEIVNVLEKYEENI